MAEYDDQDPEGISSDSRTPEKTRSDRSLHKPAKKSDLVGNAISGAAAAVLVGLLPGWNLPGILPAFSGTLVLAWQAHFASGAIGSLIRLGHDAPALRRIVRVAEGSTGAYVNYLMYQNFPLDPSIWGAPGFVGTILRYIFLAGAVIHGVKAISAALKLVFGKNNEKALDPENQ